LVAWTLECSEVPRPLAQLYNGMRAVARGVSNGDAVTHDVDL